MINSQFRHEEALAIFNIMFENDLVTAYSGPFDHDVLTLLAENIEKTLWQNASLGRRFFRIFIELSQNISLYSKEKATIKEKTFGEGTMIIRDIETEFIFTAGNIVDKETKYRINERVVQINSLDRLGLRELKRKLRKEGNSLKGGNIGLVQVALLAKSRLDITFYPIENNNFFYLISVNIKKF